MDLCHVAGNEHLETISFRNQAAKFLFVTGADIRLRMTRVSESIPIARVERALDTVKQLGDGFESDDLLPGFSRDVCPRFP